MSKFYDCVAEVYEDEVIDYTQRFKVEADHPGNAIDKVKKKFWGIDTLVTAMELKWSGTRLKGKDGKVCQIF